MKFATWYLRESKLRLKGGMAILLVLGPFLFFIAHAESEPIDSLTEWLLGGVAVLILILFGKLFWPWIWLVDKPPLLTLEQSLQQRIVEVADSVDALPRGASLRETWSSLDAKQLRRVLHLLHTTRPGNRHLRDALMRLDE